jgi:hypothetical protein
VEKLNALWVKVTGTVVDIVVESNRISILPVTVAPTGTSVKISTLSIHDPFVPGKFNCANKI